MADWQTVARQAAAKYGIDPEIFIRQINQESGGRDVTSGAGAQGPAQFIPSTAREYGLNSTTVHQLGPSLDAAAHYMSNNLKTYGTYARALSAYNSGKPDAYKDPAFAGGQTYNYVKTILNGANPKVSTAPSTSSSGSASSAGGVSSTAPPAPDTGGQASDFTGLLASLLAGNQQAQQAQPMPLAPPGFASSALTPQGFHPLAASVTSQAPGQDALSANLSLVQALQGPGAAGTSPGTDTGAQAASSASTGGIAAKVQQQRASGFHGSGVLELIYNDGGKGYGIKNGQIVDAPATYSDVWAGHTTHVHVAAGRKTVVQLGKLAQSMGLHVGENPSFGGVDPVHVPGSYHYKGEAIDVSGGSSAALSDYAKAVEQYNRTHRL